MRTILGVCLLVVSLIVSAQDKISLLQEGDLLFCLSGEENIITQVTEGIGGSKVDHVGIVHLQNDSVYVLEAIHRGVVLTPVDTFLVRRDSLVMAARLRNPQGVEQSVRRALAYLGRPYDFLFMPDDSELYCSELVQKCYLNADGSEIFPAIPMSFNDKTGTVTQYWKNYYARRGKDVPEGESGSNPGDLSRSGKIKFLFRFY